MVLTLHPSRVTRSFFRGIISPYNQLYSRTRFLFETSQSRGGGGEKKGKKGHNMTNCKLLKFLNTIITYHEKQKRRRPQQDLKKDRKPLIHLLNRIPGPFSRKKRKKEGKDTLPLPLPPSTHQTPHGPQKTEGKGEGGGGGGGEKRGGSAPGGCTLLHCHVEFGKLRLSPSGIFSPRKNDQCSEKRGEKKGGEGKRKNGLVTHEPLLSSLTSLHQYIYACPVAVYQKKGKKKGKSPKLTPNPPKKRGGEKDRKGGETFSSIRLFGRELPWRCTEGGKEEKREGRGKILFGYVTLCPI